MKARLLPWAVVLILLSSTTLFAQSQFSLDAYQQFLASHADMDAEDIQQLYPQKTDYWSSISYTDLNAYQYLDSVQLKLGLTASELAALDRRHFVITERLTYPSMGEAYLSVFENDLPVFVSTDAILHALHRSYDEILIYLEYALLRPELDASLEAMYNAFPTLMSRYQNQPGMAASLEDVDLYISVARALLEGEYGDYIDPQCISYGEFLNYFDAIEAQTLTSMPLFSESSRKLDFSQFIPRGHYNDYGGPLSTYFQAMMWLGRMDFLLTVPSDSSVTDSDVRRMNIDAVLFMELIELSGTRNRLDTIDDILEFMVGESDNLTIAELEQIIHEQELGGASDLLTTTTYSAFSNAIKSSPLADQKILSNVIIYEWGEEPPPLPVSFKLMGQRFIIDSYVTSKVVFPNIRYENVNVWRPMPDPLDVVASIGNEDALQLMSSELDEYHYATALAGMRYLIESYDDEFWSSSLYNIWLNSIRKLNPPANDEGLPFFMKTTGWHQQKLNTQLASWAQLRHDNLLYAKQSYTGGTTCYYPYGYVEPYPEFYGSLRQFADEASTYFTQLAGANSISLSSVVEYFDRLGTITDTLETIASKELEGIPFDELEEDFLKRVVTSKWTTMGCGVYEPAGGWYVDLFYASYGSAPSINCFERDNVIADVHTQPTLQGGAVIGNVLHVGVGDINLGVFLVEQSHDPQPYRAYVGPALSYFEEVKSNFQRMTDEEWTERVENGDLPSRPDWVNVYLADENGELAVDAPELNGGAYIGSADVPNPINVPFALDQNYPNPFNPNTVIRFQLPKAGRVQILIFDILGRQVASLANGWMVRGTHEVTWDGVNNKGVICPSGVYIYQLKTERQTVSKRMVLLK